MKHSDWDIWKKKLDELPVNSDAGLSWRAMQTVLDKNLPIVSPPAGGGSMVKLIVKKFVSALGYVLPAAAMVAAVTYIALKDPKPEVQHPKKKVRLNAGTIFPQPAMSPGDTLELSRRYSAIYNSEKRRITEPATGDTFIPAEETLTGNSTESVSARKQLTTTSLYPHLISIQMDDNVPTKIQARLDQLKLSETRTRPEPHRILNSDGDIQSQTGEQKSNRHKLPRIKTVRKRPPKLKKTRTKPPKAMAHIQGSKGLNYGPETGINVSTYGTGIYYGTSASYALNRRLLSSASLKINTKRTLEGSYSHHSYNVNDPDAPVLRITDSRKFSTIDIPLQLEYELYNGLSIKAGPVLSFQSKQSGPGSKFDKIINPYDTVYHSRALNEALANTQMNRVRTAFSAGIKLRLKKFSVEAGYLRNLSPYKVSSTLGAYQSTYSTISFGVGYRFK
jgi:hypothetical protein